LGFEGKTRIRSWHCFSMVKIGGWLTGVCSVCSLSFLPSHVVWPWSLGVLDLACLDEHAGEQRDAYRAWPSRHQSRLLVFSCILAVRHLSSYGKMASLESNAYGRRGLLWFRVFVPFIIIHILSFGGGEDRQEVDNFEAKTILIRRNDGAWKGA